MIIYPLKNSRFCGISCVDFFPQIFPFVKLEKKVLFFISWRRDIKEEQVASFCVCIKGNVVGKIFLRQVIAYVRKASWGS